MRHGDKDVRIEQNFKYHQCNIQSKRTAIVGLNTGVLFMSISALFAKLLPWEPTLIIFGRCLFAAPMLFLFLLWKKQSIVLRSKKDCCVMIALAALLVIHWVTYYQSIQITTVALAMVCIWTHPIISTFIEPLLEKKMPALADVGIAILAFIGVIVLIDNFSFGSQTLQGVLFGMISAVTMSIRTIFSKHYVKTYSGGLTMFYQLLFGCIILSPFYILEPVQPSSLNVLQLLILALVATAIAHTLVLSSLHQLTARTSGILSVIQPVYGVILAYFVLSEIPSARELIGCSIIISAVMIETVRQQKNV